MRNTNTFIFEECPSPPSCNLGQAPQKKQDKEDKDSSPSPPSYILRRQHREEEKQDEGSPSISTSSPVKTKSPVDAQSSFGVFDVVEDTGPDPKLVRTGPKMVGDIVDRQITKVSRDVMV